MASVPVLLYQRGSKTIPQTQRSRVGELLHRAKSQRKHRLYLTPNAFIFFTCYAIDQPCTSYNANSCFREIVQSSKVWHANLNSTFFFIKSFFQCLSLSCFTCFLRNIDYQCASHTLSLLFPFDWSCQGSLATSRMVWCCDLVRNCATMGTWSDGCCLMRAKILNSPWFCAQKLRCAFVEDAMATATSSLWIYKL